MGSHFDNPDDHLDLSLLISDPSPDHLDLSLLISDLSPDHLLLSDLSAPAVSSPTIFLDLPPNPTQEHDPEQEPDPIPSMDSPEDLVLPYISRMLMEEDIDDKFFYEYPDHPALLAAEKPFLDILSTDSGASLTHSSSLVSDASASSPSGDDNNNNNTSTVSASASWAYDPIEYRQLQSQPYPFEVPSFGLEDSELLSSAFLKGMEEAKKFLPSDNKLVIDLESSAAAAGFSSSSVTVKEESETGISTRGRKNRYGGEEELEVEGGRSSKQTAVQPDYVNPDVREMFDKVMLADHEMCVKGMQDLRLAMQNEAAKNASAGGGQGNGKGGGRGRRQSREVVDLRTLLIHCAQAVATDDRRSANELLKQIKQHATPTGDATQRLAHCFAEGLQARLAGTGSQVYQALMAKRTSAVDLLNAYQLYMAACCFKKVSYLFSNQTIFNAAAGASKLHIIDYGINYGFQWPCLFRRLREREGGPPKLTITGIDLPQPGFRPAERIEETGRRLSDYASEYGVPFEFRPIAAKLEAIRVEDLKIDPDEVLVVNSLYQFRSLMDESVMIDSPRDIVLNTIRKMRPHVFIHGDVNGSFGAPFFVTRFREALFYYSALFDMLEATTPRESDQRLLIERDLFGRGALNVISCEGSERVERPETYKQWQVRNLRAGLKQLPLNRDIVGMARDKVKKCYHKDFVIDEDHQWLLQGWKGRILFAISTWVADDASSDF